MSRPARSSARCPTACSGITSTRLPPPRAPTPGSGASTRPSPCSGPASNGDNALCHADAAIREEPMADADDVRRLALALPHVEEIDSDGFDFRVGGHGFVWSYPERTPGGPRVIRTD